MAISIKGQSALVIGASSGMGRETALALGREGVRVLASGRRQAQLDELRAAAEGEGLPVGVAVSDTTKRADVDQLVADALKHFGGKIDVLVYSAGNNIKERAIDVLKPETWDEMVAVNLTGAFLATRAVLPSMRAAGGGLIVYVSSIAAHLSDGVSGVAYQAAKRGLSGLAHGTRLEERKNGIRCSVLFPGLCDTDLIQRRPTPPTPEVLAQALKPSDVAEAVVAVCRFHPRAVVPELEIVPSRLM